MKFTTGLPFGRENRKDQTPIAWHITSLELRRNVSGSTEISIKFDVSTSLQCISVGTIHQAVSWSSNQDYIKESFSGANLIVCKANDCKFILVNGCSHVPYSKALLKVGVSWKIQTLNYSRCSGSSQTIIHVYNTSVKYDLVWRICTANCYSFCSKNFLM